MLRLIHLVYRTPAMSAEQFRTQWRDRHGPLVASLQTDLDLVRYVQLQPDPAGQGLDRQACEARGTPGDPPDGVAEYWWRSEQAFAAAMSTDQGRAASAALAQSEAALVDPDRSAMWFAHEYAQVATGFVRPVARYRSGVMRLLFAFQQLPHLSMAEAQRYWLGTHGPIIRSHSAARGLLAYNQVHRFDSRLLESWAPSRNARAEPYIGHAESWFDRLSGPAGPELENAKQAALADEQNFIDWSRAAILVGKECVFVDRDWASYGELM